MDRAHPRMNPVEAMPPPPCGQGIAVTFHSGKALVLYISCLVETFLCQISGKGPCHKGIFYYAATQWKGMWCSCFLLYGVLVRLTYSFICFKFVFYTLCNFELYNPCLYHILKTIGQQYNAYK